MSKKQNKPANPFKYTTQSALPRLGKIKTTWDLKNLYYSSPKDPQIEKDIQKAEQATAAFAKKWRSKSYTNDPNVLLQALTEYEELSAMPEASRPIRYFQFRSVLDANDTVAQKQLAVLSERYRKMGDSVLFFSLQIAAINKKDQKKLLQAEVLEPYAYYLKRTWLGAAHNLSEAEEKIINLKSRQASGMWINMVDKIISNRTITYKKQPIHVNEALEMLESLPPKEKPKLWEKIIDEMEKIAEVSEHEFNAVISDAHKEDDLRGYEKPYSATALAYEDNEKSIESLVHAVSTKGFALSKKFYKLKAAYHGVEQIHYARKYDSIGSDVTIPFTQAVDICRDVFYGLKNDYGELFDRMLERGQIDVYPKPGKSGGAFMSDTVNQPTHVMLNHADTFKSLETLAHEMGHAIHAGRSKMQRPFYQGHSVTTAETASTLFENLLFDAVYQEASAKDKPVLLHNRIARDIATIQRQIACFNTELDIHKTIKAQGAMTSNELRDCLYKHLKSYCGPAVAVEKRDGYSFVYWSHLRYGFYVYTYSFGILMSTIMANHYKADKSYIKEIDQFLCAGESDTVANIFQSIGIDTRREDTFIDALKNHEADINEFASFAKSS